MSDKVKCVIGLKYDSSDKKNVLKVVFKGYGDLV